MFRIEKRKDEDFTVLNLSDPQIADVNLYEQDRIYNVMVNTVKELVEREKPDLITVSGDISYGSGPMDTYSFFADFIDSFQIPWSVVWGNHDNQGGQTFMDGNLQSFAAWPHGMLDAGNHVRAKLPLWVHAAGLRQHRPAHAVHKIAYHRGRADVNGTTDDRPVLRCGDFHT